MALLFTLWLMENARIFAFTAESGQKYNLDQVEITKINIWKKYWEKLDKILQKIWRTVTKIWFQTFSKLILKFHRFSTYQGIAYDLVPGVTCLFMGTHTWLWANTLNTNTGNSHLKYIERCVPVPQRYLAAGFVSTKIKHCVNLDFAIFKNW